jgi:hypothetical protein
MVSPLTDVLNSINKTKVNLENEPGFVKAYPKFVVQRIMSYFPDSFPLAAAANQFRDMPATWHYHLFLHGATKKNRFFKRAEIEKAEINEKLVTEYLPKLFKCGLKEAREMVRVLNQQDIDDIIQTFEHTSGNKDEHPRRKRTIAGS